MPIPDYQTLMRPVLVTLDTQGDMSLRNLVDLLSDQYQLTDEERRRMTPSKRSPLMYNRVAWATTYLRKAGLIESPQRGISHLTAIGRQVLAENPEKIDASYLKQFEAFEEFRAIDNRSTEAAETQTIEVSEALDPTERLEQAHQELQASLADDLLAQVKRQTPEFFEKLVVELMLAMGYGGWSEKAGQATQYTNDGGVDGIINEDPLGLDTIYLQAKRYTGNSVGRPDVQAFVGALEMKRARKGVFITTSRFSRDAIDYVNMIEKRVVLIDGMQLAELMIRYDLGVTVKDTYQVKSLDTDYFAEG
ncbi:restriction endonuclease [Thalassolituus sp. UBA3500]|uniref:restriction endonuclease n=1 Tax=Thalassolituus sp. UBA3500 TaxID=1947664 RepID=UPI000C109B16|nr:restriction endonuclease [Thalassolituus sp. UBA3500]MBN56321.1 restriction endonuclease [Oceanospirillaceae bacterium]|tara:strand:- start:998 stop:1915 length:918 start_codon:yes stop_codon:yes gene_type:complete